MNFSHLHNHTQFSMLDGAASISQLIKKSKKHGMPGIAITDHGNMFGVPEFVNEAHKHDVKPIIGCEFYITPSGMEDKKDRTRYHQVLLAKNMTGYRNLSKLCSLGYTEGMYYKPRIDKETLAQHAEGLIATTCCIASEINQTIINGEEKDARALFEWYLNVFGDDYYIELQRHGLADQDRCNEVLVKWAKEYNVKMVATNDCHYVEEEDSEAHDILLALQTNADINDPNRFRFTDDNNNLNTDFYLKTPGEMEELFSDLPSAIDNTNEIIEKVDDLDLSSELLLPHYSIPDEYDSMYEYLRKLTYDGAKERYGEVTQQVSQRIEQELKIISEMDFVGYFLITQDFTTEARNRGVFVGPGRGSAAGSIIAYCLGIINIDPLRHDLLFERFLNPERVSPPDIDIDFDDTGRQEVIDYVVEKYGREKVAQIVTYGTMKAKTAIRDVGRVLGVPLEEVDRITKMFPDQPGVNTFDKVLDPSKNPESAKDIKQLFDHPDPQVQKMMRFARTLEGSARQTGIHAAGVIIAPGEISEYVPVALSKDKELITQYDGPHAEECGLLKMDFLGLKTLSILKTAIQYVEENHDVHYELDEIPEDDEKTFELYQKGNTIGTFQFESDGMRKYLKQLKPTELDDLIAMNALYRPGPMQFIPEYIDRKHGRTEVEYPHPDLEELLKPTYGIMIYQEQIMKAAQKIANYSLGEADLLRRAMGKKKKKVMDKQREIFTTRAIENGVDEEKAEELFDIMAEFANYGFNKSHSAAYSVVAYQTAFFKANYPAEYMAAVLSHNMGDIDKVSKFIEECNRNNITVDPPNINTGAGKFVAVDGHIQYGMEAIKGVGSNAILEIVEERKENGKFESIFDFARRVDSRLCNKRTLESLFQAGAFDCLNPNRHQLLQHMEIIISYGSRVQELEDSNQSDLFGDGGDSASAIDEPTLEPVQRWSNIERLNKERELIGFYLSGHPLDKFKEDVRIFCSHTLNSDELEQLNDRTNVRVAGIITKVNRVTDKKGRPFAFLEMEDRQGVVEVVVFNDVYDSNLGMIQEDTRVVVDGNFDSSRGKLQIIANSFERIESMREKYQDQIELKLNIDTNYISESDLQEMAELFKQNQGETNVSFNVLSKEAKRPFKMHVRKFVVDPNEELLSGLKSIVGEDAVALDRSKNGGR
ncbi:DNA polymerase III subunit alpha [Fodinibius halophilus]|uniref:DNA polymerase III subunit alpha n=1 Tax=Fodinibius halophilus TaxID=1736908 RepID=A0A6M1T5L3_9BACT|nr:DNA polymerase III subunit alpha [Fodinibius halophilus]NGP89349.1 DNA polymerase III subunit alpha [Fodinibius halophilus]